MALITIPQILKFFTPLQRLIICDDGTLNTLDKERLGNISSLIKIVTRVDREDLIKEEIGNRPNCLKYREEFPLAYKLLDIPILAKIENSRFTFTDSDIIYIKNCDDYFNRTVNTYLQTDAIKLSVKLSAGLLKYKWKIPMRFNSGYFSFDMIDYDLDFLEYYLGLPDVRNMPWLSEQTGWALLFGKAGNVYSPNENQFICKEKYKGPTDETLAIHLIANLKNKYEEWSPSKEIISDIKPEFKLSRNINIGDWIKKSVVRFI